MPNFIKKKNQYLVIHIFIHIFCNSSIWKVLHKCRKVTFDLNLQFTSKGLFYHSKKIEVGVAQNYAFESIRNARNNISDDLILNSDGRYSIRRNSPHCTFEIIYSQNNKVVKFLISDKKGIYHPEETFTKSSNLLESNVVKNHSIN